VSPLWLDACADGIFPFAGQEGGGQGRRPTRTPRVSNFLVKIVLRANRISSAELGKKGGAKRRDDFPYIHFLIDSSVVPSDSAIFDTVVADLEVANHTTLDNISGAIILCLSRVFPVTVIANSCMDAPGDEFRVKFCTGVSWIEQ
jgi:hypothetical protein